MHRFALDRLDPRLCRAKPVAISNQFCKPYSPQGDVRELARNLGVSPPALSTLFPYHVEQNLLQIESDTCAVVAGWENRVSATTHTFRKKLGFLQSKNELVVYIHSRNVAKHYSLFENARWVFEHNMSAG